jgi:hypothetical protein
VGGGEARVRRRKQLEERRNLLADRAEIVNKPNNVLGVYMHPVNLQLGIFAFPRLHLDFLPQLLRLLRRVRKKLHSRTRLYRDTALPLEGRERNFRKRTKAIVSGRRSTAAGKGHDGIRRPFSGLPGVAPNSPRYTHPPAAPAPAQRNEGPRPPTRPRVTNHLVPLAGDGCC